LLANQYSVYIFWSTTKLYDELNKTIIAPSLLDILVSTTTMTSINMKGSASRAFILPESLVALQHGNGTPIDNEMLRRADTLAEQDDTIARCIELLDDWILHGAHLEVTFGNSHTPLKGDYEGVFMNYLHKVLREDCSKGFIAWDIPGKKLENLMTIDPSLGHFELFISENENPHMVFFLKPYFDLTRSIQVKERAYPVTITRMPKPWGQLTSKVASLAAKAFAVDQKMDDDSIASAMLSRPPLCTTEKDLALQPGVNAVSALTATSTIHQRTEVAAVYADNLHTLAKENEKNAGDLTTIDGEGTTWRRIPDKFEFSFPRANQMLRGPFASNEHDLLGKQVVNAQLPVRDPNLIGWDERLQRDIAKRFGIPFNMISGEGSSRAIDHEMISSGFQRTLDSYARVLEQALEDVLNRGLYASDTEELVLRSTDSKATEESRLKAQNELKNSKRYHVKIVMERRATLQDISLLGDRGHLSEKNERRLMFDLLNIPMEYGEGAPGMKLAATARLLREEQRAGIKRPKPDTHFAGRGGGSSAGGANNPSKQVKKPKKEEKEENKKNNK
jgi:hypothetical protein